MTKLNSKQLYAAQASKHDGKVDGAWPTNAQFEAAHTLARPATKTAFALAMYLRPRGATTSMIARLNDGPYLNAMRTAVTAGKVERVLMPNVDGHTCYRIEAKLAKADTPKAGNGKAKPKVKRTRKPKAAKPAAPAAPAADVAPEAATPAVAH